LKKRGSIILREYQGLKVPVRLRELDFNDDKVGKPVAINKFIGRRR
jgi:hypothetical protein